MIVGGRLRKLRQEKGLSQAEVEERSGLLRCYISRVENGHTVPSVGTLEKLARALEVPLYRLFYEGEKPPKIDFSDGDGRDRLLWGSAGRQALYLGKLREFLGKAKEEDRKLILAVVKLMSRRRERRSPPGGRR
jgi:transcriptional regulator with XRE-family HTH domain